jgi:hypothetical protein
MRLAWGDHTAVLWLMGAPSDGGGAGGSPPASPARSVDRADLPGGAHTWSSKTGSPGQGTREGWEGVELRARAGVGVRETDGRDSTARRTGPCGSPGATRAVENGG